MFAHERPRPRPEASTARRREGVIKAIALVGFCALASFIGFVLSHSGVHPTPRTPFPAAVPQTIARGNAAPSFDVKRLGTNGSVTLSGLRGKPAVVNFFASWCENCRAELTALAQLDSYSAGRVNVIGIDADDADTSAVTKLLDAAGVRYPIGIDRSGSVASAFSVDELPVTFFLDPTGHVVGELFGSQSLASFKRGVANLLAAESTSS